MVLLAIAAVACAREPKEEPPKPVPHWVTSTRIKATASRPSFDRNVEVFVNIENLSSSALRAVQAQEFGLALAVDDLVPPAPPIPEDEARSWAAVRAVPFRSTC